MLQKILDLSQELDFPGEMCAQIAEIWPSLNLDEITPHAEKLTSASTAQIAHGVFTVMFDGNDPMGYKSLIAQLIAALQTREFYRANNIPDNIFLDTVKCLSRFSKEHKVSFGHYGYNRSWWSYRYVAGIIFRLGALEFEIAEDGLSVHIPSDAVMTEEALADSYAQATRFFQEHGVVYEKIYCNTWLLHPILQQLLPPNSRILNFQKGYEVTKLDPDSTGYMRWVYKNEYTDLTQLPEDTVLQRELKKWLLAGGKMGDAYGVYSDI